MKRLIVFLFFVAGVGHTAGGDLEEVLSLVKERYNRIESFTADAFIYEYFG